MHCTPHNLNKSEGVADPFGQQLRWLRGVDLNHRPLGYEPINNLLPSWLVLSLLALTSGGISLFLGLCGCSVLLLCSNVSAR